MLLISVIVIAAGCKKDPDEIVLGGGNGTFTDDRDGQVYGYVQIGDQVWMSENLAYLPSFIGLREEWKYFVYDYQGTSVTEAKATDNYKQYGVLYNYSAAKVSCPYGWHLPIEDEINLLISQLGSAPASQLKSTSGWLEETNALNTTGFSATPAGSYDSPDFAALLYSSNYWIYDKDCVDGAPAWGLLSLSDNVYQWLVSRENADYTGYSVRCLKNGSI